MIIDAIYNKDNNQWKMVTSISYINLNSNDDEEYYPDIDEFQKIIGRIYSELNQEDNEHLAKIRFNLPMDDKGKLEFTFYNNLTANELINILTK